MSRALLLLLLAAGALHAQWPSDPAQNLVLCDRAGEQTLPKVVGTSDGGCYVSWQDNASGNYDTYLQRLDAAGVPQWADGGLLVSGHPQESWITDYDLAVDRDDCAVVAINDSRSGSDRDITAYRIDPDGGFLWGADGLAISDNDGFEPDPRICVTESGEIVFAWQEDSVIHLRRLTATGEDVWEPTTITLSAEFTLSIPRLAPALEDGVFLQWLEAQGSQFWSPKHLRLQRFAADGSPQWAEPGLAIQTAGGFGPQMRPDLRADGSGGACSFWYDSRDNTLHAFAQRTDAEGVVQWAENGLRLSDTAGELQMEPAGVLCEADFGFPWFEFYYRVTNSDQNQIGLAGQRVDFAGERQWGDGGLVFEPLGAAERNSLRAVRAADRTLLAWQESPQGDAVNARVVATALDMNGDPLWEPARTVLADPPSEKVHFAAGVTTQNRLVAAWRDGRSDSSGDLLLQNVNDDGSLGPGEDVTVEPLPLPTAFDVSARPNPFNPKTTIVWSQPESGHVLVRVCDLLGRVVATPLDGWRSAGVHAAIFDGDGLASGSYWVRIEAPGRERILRVTLLK